MNHDLVQAVKTSLFSLCQIPHFPASLAANGNHVTHFWPIRWKRKSTGRGSLGRVVGDTTYLLIHVLNVMVTRALWWPSWDREVTGIRTKNHLVRMVERIYFPFPLPAFLRHPPHSRPHPLSPAWWLQPLTRYRLMINSGGQAAKMEKHGEMLILKIIMVLFGKSSEQRRGRPQPEWDWLRGQKKLEEGLELPLCLCIIGEHLTCTTSQRLGSCPLTALSSINTK